MLGKDQDLASQIEALHTILLKSDSLAAILRRIPELGVGEWYVGAGCIAQTVWNHAHGFSLDTGIKDCDLAYFDVDTSYEAEDAVIQKGAELFKDIPVEVEIRNQARVHLWYEKHFGQSIQPFCSLEEALNTWPTTATTVGVRLIGENLAVYAPHGLNDLLSLVVRPNKVKITQEIYEQKVERWTKVWPKLNVIPWNE